MTTALASVPPKLRYVPSIERLGNELQRTKVQNRGLREKAATSVGMVESAAATGIGAALCGVAMGRGWSEGTIGAAGGALAVVGVVTQQPLLVQAATGMLAPLVAGVAARWSVQQQAKQAAAA